MNDKKKAMCYTWLHVHRICRPLIGLTRLTGDRVPAYTLLESNVISIIYHTSDARPSLSEPCKTNDAEMNWAEGKVE